MSISENFHSDNAHRMIIPVKNANGSKTKIQFLVITQHKSVKHVQCIKCAVVQSALMACDHRKNRNALLFHGCTGQSKEIA